MRVAHEYPLLLSWSGRFQSVLGLVFLTSVVVVSFVSPELLAEQSANPLPPKAIADNLVHWSKQIDSFSMKWDVAYFTLRGEPYPIDHEHIHRQIKELVWTNKRQFWSHDRTYVNRDWFTREVHTHDSQVEYKAEYEEGYSVLNKPAKLRLGLWSNANADAYPLKTFLPLDGLWDSIRVTWGVANLHQAEIASHGTELWDGRVCHFIQFSNGRRILFDPGYNYLPRCIRQTSQQDSILRVVEAYREVRPGIWFPQAGYEEVRSKTDPTRNRIKRWRVVELDINQSIPIAAFQIKPVVGTTIQDTFTGFQFTYGRDMPPGTLDSGLNQRWIRYVRQGGPHPFPVPHPQTFWQRWRFLFLVSALVLCAVILAWRTLLPKEML